MCLWVFTLFATMPVIMIFLGIPAGVLIADIALINAYLKSRRHKRRMQQPSPSP
jgi:hypothetical protein